MKRILAVIASGALLGGCAFLTPKARPETAPPPTEGEPEDTTGDIAGAPAAEPETPNQASIKPKSSRQEIPGWWVSRAAAGPGAAGVLKVEMIFGDGGAFSGTILVETDGKRRFAGLDGTWRMAEDRIAVTLSDGSERTWSVAWDGGLLILKDGESELRLERAPE